MDKQDYKYPILAKPSGITLDQHSLDVMSEAIVLSSIYEYSFEKYKTVVGKDLFQRLDVACKHHDEGKADKQWQTACQADYENFVKWKKEHVDMSFADYTKQCGTKVGENIRCAGVRHEIKTLVSNRLGNNKVLQVAIAAHHSKLNFAFEDRWLNEGGKLLWDEFAKMAWNEAKNLEEAVKKLYEYSAVRSLLQVADHRASAKEDGDKPLPFSRFSYKFPHPEKRIVQQLVEKNWEDDLLLLRAPTGAGKTDASLLWASLQIKNRRAERLIVAMPTRFTSNALAINVSESLSDTGLYHSSAWYSKFAEDVRQDAIQLRTAQKLHEMARLLQTPVTVCTIDHLLMALTLTREDHHTIAFNLANSCLVIDEADFYDDFTQANINVLLKVLKKWNVPVLLMSASLPESVLSEYQSLGYDVKEIVEDKSDIERVRFEVKAIKEYQAPTEIEDLLNRMVEKGSGIIYVNTVDKAFEYSKWFEQKGFEDVIIYHSRFTEPDKKLKEAELIAALGKDAWKDGRQHGIAIMTQIGEMSINISADIMISEMCPIDRLTQRAGRLCRFDKTKVGELYVLNPIKNGNKYPAPYGTYNKKNKCWMACEAFTKSSESLECKGYNANELVGMLNDVYSSGTIYSSKAKGNAKILEECIKNNWLISPMQKSEEDDTETDYWSSRNIPAQESIYVSKPDSLFFPHWRAFQEWQMSNSLELPLYLIEKGKKSHMFDIIEISIGYNEKRNIIVVNEGFYDSKNGINYV